MELGITILTDAKYFFMKVDILAIGVHPDDVELSCSGTLIKEIKSGKKSSCAGPYGGRIRNAWNGTDPI